MENKFIHISERYNRDSILKNGLHPSFVELHMEVFRERGYLTEDEKRMLYLWLSSEKDDKYIKDMIYCKTWIQPRNDFYFDYEDDIYFDFSTLPTKVNYWTPYTNMIFDVYEVSNVNLVNSPTLDVHCQEPQDEYNSTLFGMDDRFAHDDKELGLSKSIEKDIRIIKQAFLDIDVRGNIDIKIKDI